MACNIDFKRKMILAASVMKYGLIPSGAAIDLNAVWGFFSFWFWVHMCETWYLQFGEILNCEATPEVVEDSLLAEVSAQRWGGTAAFRQLSIFSAVKIWKASIQT